MFGLMDAGISYVSNQGGHGAAKFDDNISSRTCSVSKARRISARARVRSSGSSASIRSATARSSAAGCSRTAYVGLQNDRYGTLTLGNQYEFMVDALAASGNEIAQDLVGLYGFRNGPFDKLALPNNPTGAFDWDRVAAAIASRIRSSTARRCRD